MKGSYAQGSRKESRTCSSKRVISYELFDRVKADPSIEVVEEAAAVYQGKRLHINHRPRRRQPYGCGKRLRPSWGRMTGTLKEYLAGKPIEGTLPLTLCHTYDRGNRVGGYRGSHYIGP